MHGLSVIISGGGEEGRGGERRGGEGRGGERRGGEGRGGDCIFIMSLTKHFNIE